jgi:major membrane immunogen (membrane-anchored lipoprotein)
MKAKLLIFTCIIVFYSCTDNHLYKNNGIFEGRSQSKYIDEPYVGISTVHIINLKIGRIDFRIVDTSKNELFDSTYESHFLGNEEYTNQCRNDWKGVNYYPKKLIKTQSMERVDAVTGATWSYNLFKSSTLIALQKASK